MPRLTDLHAVLASTAGKIELEYAGEEKKEDELIERLINRAVLEGVGPLPHGRRAEAGHRALRGRLGRRGLRPHAAPTEYLEGIRSRSPACARRSALLGPFESPGLMAAATEFVLEGLHLHQKLNKDRDGGAVRPTGPERAAMLVVRYTAWDGTQQVRLNAEQVVRQARPSSSRTPTTCSRRSTGCCARALEIDGHARARASTTSSSSCARRCASATATSTCADALDELREKLDELLDLERDTLDGLGDASERAPRAKRAFLDQLPPRLSRGARAARSDYAVRGRRGRGASSRALLRGARRTSATSRSSSAATATSSTARARSTTTRRSS